MTIPRAPGIDMKGACLRHTEVPSTSALFADLLYDFERVAEFYPYRPRLDSAHEAARRIEFSDERRRALVEALGEQNQDGGATVAGNLDRLARPGTVVVATGQQVGLYGGPVFALYKALTAAKFAARLSDEGLSAVPVFWLATEDHDLAEIDHVWAFDENNRPVRLRARAEAFPNQRVGGVRIVEAGEAELRAALEHMPHGAEALALAAEAYAPGTTFGEAFARLFRRLLEPYGVILLDPLRPRVRELAAPLMTDAIARMPELVEALLERGERLAECGYHRQVLVTEATSLVFRVEADRRIPLKRKDGRFHAAAGRSYSSQDLLSLAAEQPDGFSPNALLRPVVQDFLLPTAVYIGGPAELAYMAQAEVLYERLLGRSPVVMPRASFTVVDARAAKLLERYRLQLSSCFAPRAEVERRIAETLIPDSLRTELRSRRGEIERSLAAIDQALARFDPTLREALARSRCKIAYQLQKIEDKAAREALRRGERARLDADYLLDALYPRTALQERLYSALPFLARHGRGWIASLYQAIHPECPDHQLLAL